MNRHDESCRYGGSVFSNVMNDHIIKVSLDFIRKVKYKPCAKGGGEAWFVICVEVYGILKYSHYGFYAIKKNYYCYFFRINEGEIKGERVCQAHMCVVAKVHHGILLVDVEKLSIYGFDSIKQSLT